MQAHAMLTTQEAARLVGVSVSTLKRWADDGLVPIIRTPGGHRRIERHALDHFIAELSHEADEGWLETLLTGNAFLIEAAVLSARARLGDYASVTDEIARSLVAMGDAWERGEIAIADEHRATESLSRVVAKVGAGLPVAPSAPVCVLAAIDDEEHTLGLALAELAARESGLDTVWLGRRTPVAEIERIVRDDSLDVAVVAVSASSVQTGAAARRRLAKVADRLARACARRGAALALGGRGGWPDRAQGAERIESFRAFAERIADWRADVAGARRRATG